MHHTNTPGLATRQRAVAAAISLLSTTAALAADPATAPPAAADAASGPVRAASETIVITGNPLGSRDLALPASTLSGDQLVQQRGSSLGETLGGMAGVSSTYFGPNANRPIIRGQDGDRIRVLSNSGASLDASSLSFDHAVPIDPLAVERIEVLRGPAALLYGGSAVGGVVNTIDNRIPRTPLSGVSGAFELRGGGPATERSASGLVEVGGSGFALHADAFGRKTEDLRVPDYDRPTEDGGTERSRRVVNSASDAKGGAFGGSLVWDHGYLGASFDTYRNDYGAVAEEDVTIQMKRDKFALAGEVRDLGGFITTLRAQAGFTDYKHQEIEGTGEVGTTFKNRGGDLRLEAVHAKQPLGGGELEGVFGFQGESAQFQALGEEAFVPTTHTRQAALFVVEQWNQGGLQLSAGLRAERTSVDSDGDADAEEPKFGPAESRSFTPASASLGAVWKLDPAWQLSANAAFTERAPTSYELYADGVHAATGTYERGSLAQSMERGANLDLGLQWKRGPDFVKATAFWSRFSNYIALMKSSDPDFIDEEGGSVPIYDFRGVGAQLYGAEIEGGKRLWQGGGGALDLEAQLDAVRGENKDSGQPLPRLAPLRAKLALKWQGEALTARIEVEHAARQDRVPDDDVATPSWTMVNLYAAYKLHLGDTEALAFLKVNNVGNELAYNASTIDTVRPLAPLPGRGVMAGVHIAF